jgi:DNA-directed RNA polymerase subunit RPC12/RpoP
MTIEGCPGSQKFRKPQPEEIKCIFCGEPLEIWTDEFRVRCPNCKNSVTRDAQSCLDWCKAARECVGDEVYKRYVASKNILTKSCRPDDRPS